jgi:hypothetical protein
MIFTCLYRYETVCIICFYPTVSPIRIKGYRIADSTPDAVLIYLEVMLTTFGLLNIQYFPGVSLNDDLGLQRMALFFPE